MRFGTCRSLSKECLSFACMYQDPYGLYQPPEWCDDVGGTCEPSYNIAPTSYCPVLVDHSKLEDGMPPKRVLAPMRWGLLPSWYQGGLADFKLNTFNCRVEGCQRRNCYQPAIASGRRCVVLAEGYFEWKKPSSGEKKEPYFVYFKQPAGISMVTRDWDCDGKENLLQGGCWRGPKLLTMAGIFDKNAGVYSFSILTMRAPEYMAWLHDRVPVVLEEEAVNAWLDPVHDTMQAFLLISTPDVLPDAAFLCGVTSCSVEIPVHSTIPPGVDNHQFLHQQPWSSTTIINATIFGGGTAYKHFPEEACLGHDTGSGMERLPCLLLQAFLLISTPDVLPDAAFLCGVTSCSVEIPVHSTIPPGVDNHQFLHQQPWSSTTIINATIFGGGTAYKHFPEEACLGHDTGSGMERLPCLLLQLIQSVHFPSTLDWHQVGSQVGNTRNKGMDCVLPVKKTESKQKRSVLDAWLLKVTTEKAGPSTSTSTRSQSPLNAEPKDEPALQVKEEPGPQGAAVQVKEEPGVQEAASEEKQEGSAQGKEAPVQQPATEMKVEAKELVNAESVMQLKEEGGAQQQKKRRLD
ncbi:uncharacterized protein LOC119160933 isoform X5 [Rhipicephalus microplus]|uniref:uncharacterized protein LOC119160933 isoform X5 n=1 Tax=Rhipicephalus microplus TaxID=6941 RepID=UPI003F6D05D0